MYRRIGVDRVLRCPALELPYLCYNVKKNNIRPMMAQSVFNERAEC